MYASNTNASSAHGDAQGASSSYINTAQILYGAKADKSSPAIPEIPDGFIMEMEAMCRKESTVNGAEEDGMGEPLEQPVKVLFLLVPYIPVHCCIVLTVSWYFIG